MNIRVNQTARREYPDSFIRDLVGEIARRVGLIDAKITIQFRVKLAEGVGSHIMEGDRHLIRINQSWSFESQLEVLAHELRHAQQHAVGRLKSVYGKGSLWDGAFYSKDVSWSDLPWEKDAVAWEHIGPEVFAELKAKGKVPESSTERGRKVQAKLGYDTRLISEMTDEEIQAYIASRA